MLLVGGREQVLALPHLYQFVYLRSLQDLTSFVALIEADATKDEEPGSIVRLVRELTTSMDQSYLYNGSSYGGPDLGLPFLLSHLPMLRHYGTSGAITTSHGSFFSTFHLLDPAPNLTSLDGLEITKENFLSVSSFLALVAPNLHSLRIKVQGIYAVTTSSFIPSLDFPHLHTIHLKDSRDHPTNNTILFSFLAHHHFPSLRRFHFIPSARGCGDPAFFFETHGATITDLAWDQRSNEPSFIASLEHLPRLVSPACHSFEIKGESTFLDSLAGLEELVVLNKGTIGTEEADYQESFFEGVSKESLPKLACAGWDSGDGSGKRWKR